MADAFRVTTAQAKSLEVAFTERFEVNVRPFVTLLGYHRIAAQTREDQLARIRRLPGNTLSAAELRAKIPVNPAVRFFLKHQRIYHVVEGTYLCRPERYLTKGYDEEPLNVTELTQAIDSYSNRSIYSWWPPRLAKPLAFIQVIGIFSPTGWDSTAIYFIRGTETATAFASADISLCLIGPSMTQIYANLADRAMAGYERIFSGKTTDELISACKAQLLEAVQNKGFTELERFARVNRFERSIIDLACKEISRGDTRYRVTVLSGQTRVLRIE